MEDKKLRAQYFTNPILLTLILILVTALGITLYTSKFMLRKSKLKQEIEKLKIDHSEFEKKIHSIQKVDQKFKDILICIKMDTLLLEDKSM